MIGGIFIAAMLGNIRFFMEFDYYRGVKLTFILPIIIVAIGYLRRFPLMGHDFATSSDFISFAKDFLRIPIRMGTLILVGLLGLVAIVFVGRSGHTAGVPVPGIEVAMRRFLETVMYARPREKEFLIGHPAFFLMVAAMYRKWPELVHFFTVLAAVIGVGIDGRNLCPYPDSLYHVLYTRPQWLAHRAGTGYPADLCYCSRAVCDGLDGKAGEES